MKGKARPKRTRLRAAAKTRVKARPVLSAEDRGTLETRIGYHFSDPEWLNRALTHPSLIDNYEGDAQFSNQRLEFLGDRVLGLVMAEILSERFPGEREGFLTRYFHKLVSGETCADVGKALGLSDFLFMDTSMQQNTAGPHNKAVGDAVEALCAAIYRDGGLIAATRFIRENWIFSALQKSETAEQNPKTRLSDWCGASRAPYAVYEVLKQSGPAHAPHFTVRVSIAGHAEAQATGASKREAEMAAARILLNQLEQDDRNKHT